MSSTSNIIKPIEVLVIGQGQGGNAKLWFDYYNQRENLDLRYTYVCRNYCSREFYLTNKYDRLYRPYNLFGLFGKNSWFVKIFVSKIYIKILLRTISLIHSFDFIHLHGNYTPDLNKTVVKYFKGAKSILSLYGSDFYMYNKTTIDALYLMNRVDYITTNWRGMYDDLISEYPLLSKKSSIGCLGVSEETLGQFELKKQKKISKIRFLSARGLYKYNNVHLLVKAFAKVFGNNPKYELIILSGYGEDIDVKKDILASSIGVKNIKLKIDKWVSQSELVEIYKSSHFNFCIGNTDQITVSITYGFLSKCINVLSPLKNYEELSDNDFKSFISLDEISTSSLIAFFRKIDDNSYVEKEEYLEFDQKKSKIFFEFNNRYQNVIDKMIL